MYDWYNLKVRKKVPQRGGLMSERDGDAYHLFTGELIADSRIT